ncbi:hypothetical protein [Hydrogenophaga sp.]|uniref:hypothetical protein n=1 Tax=Hydrogenophaga sp. TaxID=1904254 RepID=UPI0025BFFAAC|nr:hypothetical protein [Hydrogenophaga sp.]MBT9463739.1 hypothetical protein [Hydrogenophaga sp.]
MQTHQSGTNAQGKRWKPFESRIVLFGWSLLYALSLNYCLSAYASVWWSEYGFTSSDFDLWKWFAASLSILLWTSVLPKRIKNASSLFLITIYHFVGIPALVAITSLENMYGVDRSSLLPSLTLGFFLSCIIQKRSLSVSLNRAFPSWFPVTLTIVWLLCAIFLIKSFAGVMQFEGLDNIYAQREAGKAEGLIQGYAQTYFGYVLSPALLAFGLYQRRPLFILVGIVGALILYAITAEKAVIMYPLFISAMFVLMRRLSKHTVSAISITASFSFLLTIAVTFYQHSTVAEFISWYLGSRTLLMPGIFVVHYWDQFSIDGNTLWSQLKGFNLLIQTPPQYLGDERWPSLGLIVGELHLGVPTFNVNASFIASDGIASFGAIGILIAFLVFSLFLSILDYVSSGFDPILLVPLLVPLSLNLTNGSLFTALTSFGGLFWIICFVFFTRRKVGADNFLSHTRTLPKS